MEYFYRIRGKVFGPVPAKKLWGVLQSNEMSIGEIHVRRSDKTAWVPANKVRTKSSKSDPTLSLSDSSDSTPNLDNYANDSFTVETPIDEPVMPNHPPVREVPLNERSDQHTSTNPIPEVPIKFRAMRAIAGFYRAIAATLLLVGIIGALIAAYAFVLLASFGFSVQKANEPYWTLLSGGLGILGTGTIFSVLTYAVAEGFKLGIDIEHNQRVMISVLEDRLR